MTNPVEIRTEPALPEDAEAIAQLRPSNWVDEYGEQPEVSQTWLEEQRDRMTNPAAVADRAHWIEVSSGEEAPNFYRVARIAGSGAIAGYVEARNNSGENRNEQELRSVHLGQDHRGRGIGTQLLDAADTWFDPRKPDFLDVFSRNNEAQRLYVRRGYEHESAEDYNYNGLLCGVCGVDRASRLTHKLGQNKKTATKQLLSNNW